MEEIKHLKIENVTHIFPKFMRMQVDVFDSCMHSFFARTDVGAGGATDSLDQSVRWVEPGCRDDRPGLPLTIRSPGLPLYIYIYIYIYIVGVSDPGGVPGPTSKFVAACPCPDGLARDGTQGRNAARIISHQGGVLVVGVTSVRERERESEPVR
jgi:hypothetical protein